MTATLDTLLQVLDVDPDGPGRYVGHSDTGGREVADASEVLGQAVVAASKACPAKTVRTVSGTFARPVRVGTPVELSVDTVHDGRSFCTLVVTVAQGERRCAAITALLDVPGPDLLRHRTISPDSSPADALPCDMPLDGRELRLVGLADPNDPAEVGPPRIEAWLRYASVPDRADLRKALLAQFTGHLSISTAMRPYPGIGTAQAHRTISTAVMDLHVAFHEPVEWDGWIRYDHHSTAAGAGMSYARGQVCDDMGRLLASFSQHSMIRNLDASAIQMESGRRL